MQDCRDSTLVNLNGILKPTVNNRPNFAHSIDRYKAFARENMDRMNWKFMNNFLRSVEENSKIRDIYDTASFIDDFYQI